MVFLNEMTKLIGIDGLGGSGKTTFAHEMQKQIHSSVLFHLDDFIHPRKIRYDSNFEEWYCYYHLQWRYDYLIKKLLEPLKNGIDVNETIELYNKETDSYRKQKVGILVGRTVIVEGVFLQRPELRAYFDQVIFLNVSEEKRLQRVIERDTYIGSQADILKKYETRYFPAERKYVEECRPLFLADKIEE